MKTRASEKKSMFVMNSLTSTEVEIKTNNVPELSKSVNLKTNCTIDDLTFLFALAYLEARNTKEIRLS